MINALKVRLAGQEWLLLGTLQEGGPICTREQFMNGELSYAHLMKDGRIMKLREQIGTREDLTVLETVDVPEPDPVEFLAGPLGSSWDR